MNTLHTEEFPGEVSFDMAGKRWRCTLICNESKTKWWGKVLDIDANVTYEARGIAALADEAVLAVEEYLESKGTTGP